MRVERNFPVRHLRLLLNNDERERYHVLADEFSRRGISVQSLGAGPQVRRDMTIVPGRYRIALLIQESAADELLIRLDTPPTKGTK